MTRIIQPTKWLEFGFNSMQCLLGVRFTEKTATVNFTAFWVRWRWAIESEESQMKEQNRK